MPRASYPICALFSVLAFLNFFACSKPQAKAEFHAQELCDSDQDCDGRFEWEDNCLSVPNPDQTNSDTDALGDACDPCPLDPANDIDKDTVCGDVDNCPAHHNTDQANADEDAWGDLCDVNQAAITDLQQRLLILEAQ